MSKWCMNDAWMIDFSVSWCIPFASFPWGWFQIACPWFLDDSGHIRRNPMHFALVKLARISAKFCPSNLKMAWLVFWKLVGHHVACFWSGGSNSKLVSIHRLVSLSFVVHTDTNSTCSWKSKALFHFPTIFSFLAKMGEVWGDCWNLLESSRIFWNLLGSRAEANYPLVDGFTFLEPEKSGEV